MRWLSKHKPKPVAAMIGAGTGVSPAQTVRRDRQQNIKASEDCALAFAAPAPAYGLSKAALFENMVAGRFDTARRQGIRLGID